MSTRFFAATPRGVVTTVFSVLPLAFAVSVPAQLSWTERVVVAPPARVDAGLAHINPTQGLLFGGHNLTVGLRDTWRWDGTVWTQLSPVDAPSARWEHAMVGFAGGALLFGGQDGVQPLDDTWHWNGSNWSLLAPATSPSPRRGAAMAYDSLRARVVLFGGIGQLGPLADVWEWNGTNWAQVMPATSPVPQSFSGLTFDATRNLCVLFGGLNASQAPLNQTWTWNGTAWTQRAPTTNPPARSRSPLAFAPGRVMMFGGQGASAALADTWEWNGTNWQQLSPAAPIPAAGSGHVLSASPHRGLQRQPARLDLVERGRRRDRLVTDRGAGLAAPWARPRVLPVPDDPVLLGVGTVLQACCLPTASPGGFDLTNGVVASFGR